MIVILIILILILILFIRGSPEHKSISDKLKRLKREAIEICHRVDRYPVFDLRVSDDLTFTQDKNTVYLVVWDKENNRMYKDSTLMTALIHEIAHLLSPDFGHTQNFNLLEAELHSSMSRYYRVELESNYPCQK